MGRRGLRRRPPSAYHRYTEGHVYADGTRGSAETDIARGATPMVALGVDYADGLLRLRRGPVTISTSTDPCSEWERIDRLINGKPA
jgi:hypothetical protein